MKKNITIEQLREFGFLIAFGIPIIVGLILPALAGHSFRGWTLWVGFSSLILAILKPSLLFYPYKAWMALGKYLGWINSHIILGLVFLILLFKQF